MKDIILSSISNFIYENYGIQECEDPFYDIKSMASAIADAIEKSKANKGEEKEDYEFW